MMKTLSMLTVMLLLLSVAHAADVDEDSYQDWASDVADKIESEGTAWYKGQTSGLGGTGTLFKTLYDAFGPQQCGDEWITVKGAGTVIGMWLVPAVLVALIVSFGVAGVYMLGQFMQSPNLTVLAKEEFFQVGITVIRVVFIIGILVSGETLFSLSAAGSGDEIYGNDAVESIMDGAMSFSRMMVKEMVSNYSMLLIYNMVIHTLYSSTMWFGVTWRAMYSFNLGPVLKPLIDIVGTALQFLSLGISEWMLHIVTLCMFKRWSWGLFIPVAMLLRSLPHTRNGGEALFALIFAVVVFYPFMFLLDWEVHKVMRGNLVDADSAVNSFLQKSGVLGVFGTVLVAMFLMSGVFVPFFLGGALNLAFELIRSSIYYIVIMSLLLPFINIFVTLTIAKEIAAFFKVDVNFMSFLKII